MKVIHCLISSSAYVQTTRIQVDITSNIFFKLGFMFQNTNRPVGATGKAITETDRHFCGALKVASG